MKNEKKQLRELSDEELKNVTGGYLVYTDPEDSIVVFSGTNEDGTCKEGYIPEPTADGNIACLPPLS